MKSSKWLRDFLPPAILLVTLVLAWYLVAWLSGLRPFVLPTPTDVAQAAWETRGLLLEAAGRTLSATLIGLAIALALGVGLAALMDFSSVARRALRPLLVTSQTIQILAIAAIVVIWFGFGMVPAVFVVALWCFYPVAMNTADGMASADPDLIALLRSMGAKRRQIWRIVRLPAAMPSFFSGLRLAVTYCIVAATMGEWVGGAQGLGNYMLLSKNSLQTDQLFAGMLVVSLLSVVLYLLVLAIERRTLRWYHSAHREEQWDGQGIY